MMDKRDYRFDNIKGIMIFLVVFGHCLQVLSGSADSFLLKSIIQIIYSFHMPVFVFVSGYFSKKDDSRAISAYLIPYIAANAVFGILAAFIEGTHLSIHSVNPFSPNRTLWFLLSLFFWKVFLKHVLVLKHPVIISVILSLAAGCISEVSGFLSVSRTIAFFPYFISAYLIRTKNLNVSVRRQFKPAVVAAFIITEAIVIYAAFKGMPLSFFEQSSSYGSAGYSIPAGILFRCFAYIAGAVGILFFHTVIPDRRSIISTLGSNSITVYLAHYLCILLITRFLHIESTGIILAATALISLIICVVFGNTKTASLYRRAVSALSRLFVS